MKLIVDEDELAFLPEIDIIINNLQELDKKLNSTIGRYFIEVHLGAIIPSLEKMRNEILEES